MGKILALGIALALAACVAPGKVATPLPLDLAAPPHATAGFGGTWVGNWERTLDHTLVVEKIEGATASIIYSWGRALSWNIDTPGFSRVTGTISGDLLRATLANGADVVYKLSADQQSLDAQYIRQGRLTLGKLSRLP